MNGSLLFTIFIYSFRNCLFGEMVNLMKLCTVFNRNGRRLEAKVYALSVDFC